jgi:N-acetylglucosamine kinase-like BadF-type ATPase
MTLHDEIERLRRALDDCRKEAEKGDALSLRIIKNCATRTLATRYVELKGSID